MAIVRCRISFKRMKVDEFGPFGIGVRDGIFGNPLMFVTPPMPMPDFDMIITTYSNARSAYENGGSAQKGPYEIARDALIDALLIFAEYVDSVALGSSAIITTAGFIPTKETASDAPKPEQPVGVKLANGPAGVLLAECPNQRYVDTYLALLTAHEPLPPIVSITNSGQIVFPADGGPTPLSASEEPFAGPPAIIDLSKNRRKSFTGLVSGVKYYVTFVAINAQGVSQLSPAVSRICI